MCRNKTDRRIMIATLKRIARPPDSVEGDEAWNKCTAHRGNMSDATKSTVYQAQLIDYFQTAAEEVLEKIGIKL
jgi:hypothetical protein